MNTLWIFGDSFCVPSNLLNTTKQEWVEWQWILELSKQLDMHLVTCAEFGVSNDWILTQFNKHMHEFSKGDHVIVQTTEAGRYWYFDTKPYVSNAQGITDDLVKKGTLTKKEWEALKAYITYIQSDTKDNLRQQSYYAYLNTMRWVLKCNGIHMHILPGFDLPSQFPIAVTGEDIIGCMQHVSLNEFVSYDEGTRWYNQPGLPDQRLNHFSKDNHEIFVDKFIKHMDGESLDFLQGWKSNYLTIETQQADQLCPILIKHGVDL